MNSIARYNEVCSKASRTTTKSYSTSFSLGIRSLEKELRGPIHAIYGFVRFADEIVDTFHGFDKGTLLSRFRADTHAAIRDRISLNPILQSFQRVVNSYGIEVELYDTFLDSMAMDLEGRCYDRPTFEAYILGSAEVVGLMCLRVFSKNDDVLYQRLKPAAMKLGAAFQKINFLRDLKDDHDNLGRTYFPDVDVCNMDVATKRGIERGIKGDLEAALNGIRQLPRGSRLGVYLTYVYYVALFKKIQAAPCDHILKQRIRIGNGNKLALLTTSYVKHRLGIL